MGEGKRVGGCLGICMYASGIERNGMTTGQFDSSKRYHKKGNEEACPAVRFLQSSAASGEGTS